MTGPGVGAVLAYAVVAVRALVGLARCSRSCVLLGVPAIGAGRRAAAAPPGAGRVGLPRSSRARSPPGPATSWPGCGCSPGWAAGTCSPAGTPPGRRTCAPRATGSARSTAGSTRSTVAIPGLFLAAVVWLAARMAADGRRSRVGELVAVYGYVATLIVPVWFLLEGSYEHHPGPGRRPPDRRAARPRRPDRGRRRSRARCRAPRRPGRPARPGDRADRARRAS